MSRPTSATSSTLPPRSRRVAYAVDMMLFCGAFGGGLAACGGNTAGKTAPSTTAPKVVARAADGASATTADAASATGGPRLDNCAQTTPDLVATTFMSSIEFAGPEAYMQCVFEDTVPVSIAETLRARHLDVLRPIVDAATNTTTFNGPAGAKAVVTVTKQANGRFYVTKVVVS
jgi:hypothetical protein